MKGDKIIDSNIPQVVIRKISQTLLKSTQTKPLGYTKSSNTRLKKSKKRIYGWLVILTKKPKQITNFNCILSITTI